MACLISPTMGNNCEMNFNWKELDERREICYENHNVAANILTMIFHDINWACELYYIDPWLKGKARTCYR